MRRWQTFSLFALSELVCTKNKFYPILLFPLLSHPKLLPLWSVPVGRTEGQISTPLSPLLLFFPLSTRGPTRRRNSTGLAKLWGGWPIEQASNMNIFCSPDKKDAVIYPIKKSHPNVFLPKLVMIKLPFCSFQLFMNFIWSLGSMFVPSKWFWQDWISEFCGDY